MKKLLTTTLLFTFMAGVAIGQDMMFGQFKDYKTVQPDGTCKGAKLVSPPALNIHFNKQMSRYLAGSEDLVMNKTYAILNSSDNEITIGGTIARKKKSSDFVQAMMQVGVKIKADDNFGEIFNEENGLASSLGLFWKGTLFSKGIMTFGGSFCQEQPDFIPELAGTKSKEELARERVEKLQAYEKYLNVVYEASYEKKLTALKADLDIYAETYDLSDAEKAAELEKRTKALKDELTAEYMEKVQKNLASSGNFKRTSKMWASMDVFIPITATEYVTAASNTSTEYDTIQLRPYSVKLIGSYLRAGSTGSRLFFSVSPGIQVHNTITRDDLSKISFRTLIERDASNPDIELTEVSNNEVYVGEIDELIIVPAVKFTTTYMLGGDYSFVGVSGSMEYRADPDQDAVFWKVGVPFSLAGKDDETKVNFEPLAKWNTNTRNWVVGISVGLPLGKAIY